MFFRKFPKRRFDSRNVLPHFGQSGFDLGLEWLEVRQLLTAVALTSDAISDSSSTSTTTTVPGSLSGYVFTEPEPQPGSPDYDSADPATGETALIGATIDLYDDSTGDLVQSTVSGANPQHSHSGIALTGGYSFTDLSPGLYTIMEAGASLDAGNDTAISGTLGGVPGIGSVSQIEVDAGSIGTGYDLPELDDPAQLSGYVFAEQDPGSPAYDPNNPPPGETPLSGVKVTLTNSVGDFVAAVQTDANGAYSFANLEPYIEDSNDTGSDLADTGNADGLVRGAYNVSVSPSAGYTNDLALVGSQDTGTALAGLLNDVSFDSGTVGTDNDFREYLTDRQIATPVVTPSGTTNTFTVDATAVAVDSGVTVTSSDADLTGATVTITNYQSGDTLNYTPIDGITVASNTGGVLRLSGSATPAQYKAALQSVTFSTTSTTDTPRSLSIVALDTNDTGDVQSNTGAETVDVEIAAPVVKPSGTTNTFTLGGTAVAVDSGVTVTSSDTDLTGATVTINNYQSGDLLDYTPIDGITIASNSGGLLSLTGSATPSQYTAALQSVTFSTTSTTDTARSLSIVALDANDTGDVPSNTGAETVDVEIAAPVVKPSGTTNTFTLGGTAVAVDSGVTVTSSDTDLTGATVTINNYQSGDLLDYTPIDGITIASNTAGLLSLTGSATPSQYTAALQSVTFSTTSTTNTARSLSIVALDANDTGDVPSNTGAETVDVEISAPVVKPSGTTNTFTLGGTAVAVDSGVTVTSSDTDLTGATVTINNDQSGDLLDYTPIDGITIASNTAGLLSLTGSATPANTRRPCSRSRSPPPARPIPPGRCRSWPSTRTTPATCRAIRERKPSTSRSPPRS